MYRAGRDVDIHCPFAIDVVCLGTLSGADAVYGMGACDSSQSLLKGFREAEGDNCAASFVVVVDGAPLLLFGCGRGAVAAYRRAFGSLSLVPRNVFVPSSATAHASELATMLMVEGGRHRLAFMEFEAGNADRTPVDGRTYAAAPPLINIIGNDAICAEITAGPLAEARRRADLYAQASRKGVLPTHIGASSSVNGGLTNGQWAIHGQLCHLAPLAGIELRAPMLFKNGSMGCPSGGGAGITDAHALANAVADGRLFPILFAAESPVSAAGSVHTCSCGAPPQKKTALRSGRDGSSGDEAVGGEEGAFGGVRGCAACFRSVTHVLLVSCFPMGQSPSGAFGMQLWHAATASVASEGEGEGGAGGRLDEDDLLLFLRPVLTIGADGAFSEAELASALGLTSHDAASCDAEAPAPFVFVSCGAPEQAPEGDFQQSSLSPFAPRRRELGNPLPSPTSSRVGGALVEHADNGAAIIPSDASLRVFSGLPPPVTPYGALQRRCEALIHRSLRPHTPSDVIGRVLRWAAAAEPWDAAARSASHASPPASLSAQQHRSQQSGDTFAPSSRPPRARLCVYASPSSKAPVHAIAASSHARVLYAGDLVAVTAGPAAAAPSPFAPNASSSGAVQWAAQRPAAEQHAEHTYTNHSQQRQHEEHQRRQQQQQQWAESHDINDDGMRSGDSGVKWGRQPHTSADAGAAPLSTVVGPFPPSGLNLPSLTPIATQLSPHSAGDATEIAVHSGSRPSVRWGYGGTAPSPAASPTHDAYAHRHNNADVNASNGRIGEGLVATPRVAAHHVPMARAAVPLARTSSEEGSGGFAAAAEAPPPQAHVVVSGPSESPLRYGREQPQTLPAQQQALAGAGRGGIAQQSLLTAASAASPLPKVELPTAVAAASPPLHVQMDIVASPSKTPTIRDSPLPHPANTDSAVPSPARKSNSPARRALSARSGSVSFRCVTFCTQSALLSSCGDDTNGAGLGAGFTCVSTSPAMMDVVVSSPANKAAVTRLFAAASSCHSPTSHHLTALSPPSTAFVSPSSQPPPVRLSLSSCGFTTEESDRLMAALRRRVGMLLFSEESEVGASAAENRVKGADIQPRVDFFRLVSRHWQQCEGSSQRSAHSVVCYSVPSPPLSEGAPSLFSSGGAESPSNVNSGGQTLYYLVRRVQNYNDFVDGDTVVAALGTSAAEVPALSSPIKTAAANDMPNTDDTFLCSLDPSQFIVLETGGSLTLRRTFAAAPSQPPPPPQLLKAAELPLPTRVEASSTTHRTASEAIAASSPPSSAIAARRPAGVVLSTEAGIPRDGMFTRPSAPPPLPPVGDSEPVATADASPRRAPPPPPPTGGAFASTRATAHTYASIAAAPSIIPSASSPLHVAAGAIGISPSFGGGGRVASTSAGSDDGFSFSRGGPDRSLFVYTDDASSPPANSTPTRGSRPHRLALSLSPVHAYI